MKLVQSFNTVGRYVRERELEGNTGVVFLCGCCGLCCVVGPSFPGANLFLNDTLLVDWLCALRV